MADSPALRLYRRAVDEQAVASVTVMERLGQAFVVRQGDLDGGYPSFESVTSLILDAAQRLIETEVQAASNRAEDGLINPLVELSQGRMRLGEGWEDAQAAIVDFYLEKADEKLERSRRNYLETIGDLFDEADAMGWSAETLHARTVADALAAADESVEQSGALFRSFIVSVRACVREAVGMAWTGTWTAAWSRLQSAPGEVEKVAPDLAAVA